MTPLSFKFNRRVENIEARSCSDGLGMSKGPHTSIEIVKWTRPIGGDKDDESCYTLASFRETKEGYDLYFCGTRPFDLDGEEQSIFWNIAEQANMLLNLEKK